MKLEIGEKIVIKSETVIRFFMTMEHITENMVNYCGQEATIINSVNINNDLIIYKLDIDKGKYNWQDYMFEYKPILNNKLTNFCKNICKSKNCNDGCIIHKSYYDLNNCIKGSNVVFKSKEWFEYNYSKTILEYRSMKNLYSKKAKVIDVVRNYCYKLDIDNGKLDWPYFIFNSILSKFCDSECLYECKKDKCPIYLI